MRPKLKIERIFSRQEQSVVYLFSRYWEQIPSFKNKRITRIHTHFPDFSIVDAKTGKEEAIEFEYGLHAFRCHLNTGDLKKLDGIRTLYIVYWEHDDDKEDLRAKLRAKGIKPIFICLKDYFSACVFKNPKADPWQASWTFTKKQAMLGKAYSLEKIERAAARLGVERLKPDDKLYRVMGFNKGGADFIECDHWEKIHFFTTTCRFDRERIPRRLFVKPTGCKYLNGYFDIKFAFEIGKGGETVKQFFRDYYFYEYDYDYMGTQGKVKCFVCDFKRIDFDEGTELFDFLKGRYTLGVRGAVCITGEKDISKIDSIVARNHAGGGKRKASA